MQRLYTTTTTATTLRLPRIVNEPLQLYAPGSPETGKLRGALSELQQAIFDVPCVVNGERVLNVYCKKIVCVCVYV